MKFKKGDRIIYKTYQDGNFRGKIKSTEKHGITVRWNINGGVGFISDDVFDRVRIIK